MLDTAPNARMAAFLGKFDAALAAGDVDAAVAMFGAESYWRDLVAFTWNIKTMEGRDQVRDMLTDCLKRVKPRDWRVAEGEIATEADGVLESWISFETEIARGYGLIRVKDGLIWTLLTTMVELKGHEEKAGFTRALGARHGVNPGAKTWKELRDEEAEKLGYETQPYVLIIGGGQGAIGLGARLRQLGVPTIIVEKNERAGDSWRKRYKSLCLHDPVWYDHLPYLDFPKNWPVFSPKDKIGDWLEMYAKVMELNYWTKTTAKSAKFDPKKKEWTVVVDRDGKKVTLQPKQLVFATGMSSKPVMPSFKGMETFKGDQHHSSSHPGPDGYKGKKVVVIGSNNSAHDICAALYEAGVDVTMVQRSSTHISRSDTLMEITLGDLYSERAVRSGMTTAKADLVFASLPYGMLGSLQKPVYDKIREVDAKFYAALEKAGFKLDFGEDESGLVPQISAPRIRLLYRYRRVAAHHRRQDQARVRAGRGNHAERRQARQWQGSSGRRHRLCDGLRLDERLGRRYLRPGNGRQGRQGLGPWLKHQQGSRPVGGRAAQHVEADAAGGAVVPRRQPAPVAPLFAVPGAAVEGAPRGYPNAGLRAAEGPPQGVKSSLGAGARCFRMEAQKGTGRDNSCRKSET